MKKIPIEIPEGKKAEWVNNVLTLVDDKPIEYKFKVGEKVRNTIVPEFRYTVKERHFTEGQAVYMLEHELGGETALNEEYLEPIPKDITERIKTYEDAVDWCNENGKYYLVYEHSIFRPRLDVDLLAYLKLCIITAALNEGWEPTEEDEGWYLYYEGLRAQPYKIDDIRYVEARKLRFKSAELALYAANQFKDLYADFCGCRKGCEQ